MFSAVFGSDWKKGRVCYIASLQNVAEILQIFDFSLVNLLHFLDVWISNFRKVD